MTVKLFVVGREQHDAPKFVSGTSARDRDSSQHCFCSQIDAVRGPVTSQETQLLDNDYHSVEWIEKEMVIVGSSFRGWWRFGYNTDSSTVLYCTV